MEILCFDSFGVSIKKTIGSFNKQNSDFQESFEFYNRYVLNEYVASSVLIERVLLSKQNLDIGLDSNL